MAAASLDVNWEAVRMLAMEVGVRESARQLGISEEAVKKRCTREGWIGNLPRNVSLPPTVLRRVPNVPNAAHLLAEAMREDSVQTRATVLRVARRAVSRVERCDDDELLMPEIAGVLNTHTKSASVAGGWNAQTGVSVKLQLGAVAAEPLTLEAEVVSQGSGDIDLSEF